MRVVFSTSSHGSPSGVLTVVADCGRGVGLGHVVRSAALAREIQRRGVVVACATPDDHAARRVCGAYGLSWMRWPTRLPYSDLCVVDSYRAGPGDWASIRASARLLVALADGQRLPARPDVIVDGRPGADVGPYSAFGVDMLLIGPQYALVPPEFAAARRTSDRSGTVVCLGSGAGPAVDRAIVEAIQDVNPGTADLVAGPYSPSTGLAGVRIHRDLLPADIALLFGRAAFGVVGAGQTMLQAAAAGLAIVAVVVAENQRQQAEMLFRSDALLGVVHANADSEKLRSGVRDALASARVRSGVAARAAGIIDGEGTVRVAQALLGYLGAAPATDDGEE